MESSNPKDIRLVRFYSGDNIRPNEEKKMTIATAMDRINSRIRTISDFDKSIQVIIYATHETMSVYFK